MMVELAFFCLSPIPIPLPHSPLPHPPHLSTPPRWTIVLLLFAILPGYVVEWRIVIVKFRKIPDLISVGDKYYAKFLAVEKRKI
jgi:hypothetical protein